MSKANVSMSVRPVTAKTSVIDITGEVNAFSESALAEAFTEASTASTQVIILNFTGLEYMNSSGIGLLVTFLIRANRQKQRLLAYGLSDHYKRIFELTRLNEAIGVYDTEPQALEAAGHSY